MPVVNQISSELIIDRIRFENKWWVNGSIDAEFNSMMRRIAFDGFFRLVEETSVRRAVLLMGPRRVGKTVLLYHSIGELLAKKADRFKICFISVDNPVYLNLGLEKLFELAREAVADPDPAGWYVFFDEIQYLRNWEQHLKSLVDSYPRTKFIASGSAAAALKYQSTESGAGRFTDFRLAPLSFYEYIHFTKNDLIIRSAESLWKGNLNSFYTTVNIKELNKHFFDYINYGGYPEVIFSEAIRNNPGRYIKNDILDKVLLRDLPGLYGIRDVQELNSFFTVLAYNSGNEISLDSLSKNCGADKNLIKKYIEYLEAAFLIMPVHRIDNNAKRFRRATFYKIYLTNPSLRSALFAPVEASDSAAGNLVETTVFSQFERPGSFVPRYARWSSGKFQGEVDLVGLDELQFRPVWALEVKWSNRFFENPGELRSIIRFCRDNNLNTAAVTSIDKTGVVEKDGVQFHFFPASVYAYSIGANNSNQSSAQA